MVDKDKKISVLVWVLSLITAFIVPLIFYVRKNKRSEYILHNTKEALNVAITALIITAIAQALVITPIISTIMLIYVGLYIIVIPIYGATYAYKLQYYKPPLTLRLLSES
ncbi:DUF4870 domain-containing protein [Haloplasma contractile]|uniref:Membrane protein n=1 Tax=Haloplasma contractile SSD-17B TaxID=1033810 RepID=U2FKK6_9MOLU|nr:DUF4870 domain-containing protein [Haloplasma contractile]ERJ13335.1 membrane protein [Haloplasma contractile SSD-17B]